MADVLTGTMMTGSITTNEPDIMSTFDYTNVTSSTIPSCDKSDIPFFWGFVTAAIAIAFYGTNFAPVKKFDTGDGKLIFFHQGLYGTNGQDHLETFGRHLSRTICKLAGQLSV